MRVMLFLTATLLVVSAQGQSLDDYAIGVINDPDGYVNARAADSGAVIDKVAKGVYFFYLPTKEVWTKVKTLRGIVGVMHTDRIKSVDERELLKLRIKEEGSADRDTICIYKDLAKEDTGQLLLGNEQQLLYPQIKATRRTEQGVRFADAHTVVDIAFGQLRLGDYKIAKQRGEDTDEVFIFDEKGVQADAYDKRWAVMQRLEVSINKKHYSVPYAMTKYFIGVSSKDIKLYKKEDAQYILHFNYGDGASARSVLLILGERGVLLKRVYSCF